MSTVVLTCAGLSTRFPRHRAKWSITHPSGNLLAAESLRGLAFAEPPRVVVALNHRDWSAYTPAAVEREFAVAGFPGVEVVDVGTTFSQVDTVRRAVSAVGLADDEPFVVRDCDSLVVGAVPSASSFIGVVDLNRCDKPIRVNNKCFVSTSTAGCVLGVVEKRVVGHLFGCGVYGVPGVGALCPDDEFFSQVLNRLATWGVPVDVMHVDAYEDWGTEREWDAFRRGFRTLFVDIDGVLVMSSHRSFAPRWGGTSLIAANVEALNSLVDSGKVEVVLTTSRSEDERAATMEQVAGVKYTQLVMGLRNNARVVVNDIRHADADVTAMAVNIVRDSEDLGRLLGATTDG